MNRINVIFLWHFHQPYYKNDWTGEMIMPWTRLHATKDYYFMGAVLKNHPSIHATFNYSPSLLSQLGDYAGNFPDMLKNEEFLSISGKNISELTAEDKLSVINKFFPACSSGNNFLEKSPRFRQLYYILKSIGASAGYEERLDVFGPQDYLDAITLFNLLWIDPVSISSDEFLAALQKKDKKFTQEEKDRLIKEKIPQIIKSIVPLITGLAESGQAELSASPYYHPILPLLCNTDIASFNEHINLPAVPFRNPEDADYHIKSAIDYFKSKLNYKIKGMWPSEGSVSEKAARLFIDNGINWIATDEEILANSIGVDLKNQAARKLLYRPYAIKREDKYLYIFFRDKRISDLIGFKYANYPAKDAAEDLINNINNIALSLHDYNKNSLSVVPIILDGENAWEYYKNNGYDFFNYLYEGLSNASETIKTVTASEYIEKLESTLTAETGSAGPEGKDTAGREPSYEEGKTGIKIKPFPDIKWNPAGQDIDYSRIYNIPAIYPGSWINHNFRIWIGDKEDNKAWDLLSKTRNYLIEKSKTRGNDSLPQKEGENFAAAWNQIYIAEGSDYNWWYGEDRTSGIDEEYDKLYRTHLINVYNFLNDNPPDEYFIPIIEEKRAVRPNLEIGSLIHPEIDGLADDYFEWIGSAVYFPSALSGKAMAHTDRFIRKLHYGFDENAFYMRFDFLGQKGAQELKGKILIIKFINTLNIDVKLEINIDNSSNSLVNILILDNNKDVSGKVSDSRFLTAAYKKILELSMPVSVLNPDSNPGGILNFYAVLTYRDNQLSEIERFPVNGYFEAVIPDKSFELTNWLV